MEVVLFLSLLDFAALACIELTAFGLLFQYFHQKQPVDINKYAQYILCDDDYDDDDGNNGDDEENETQKWCEK